MNRFPLPPRIAAALAAVLSALVVVVGVVSVDGDQVVVHPPTATPTPASGDLVPADAADAAARAVTPAESALRDQTPAGVPGGALEQGALKTEAIAAKVLTDPLPVGGAQNYSCREAFSPSIYSDRHGVKPTEQVLHETVSSNVPGWADIYAVHNYFLKTRVGSATAIVDFEGHCLREVPESMKPWTQGAANPWAISYEIVSDAKNTRAEWLAAPLLRDGILAAIVRDSARRNGFPFPLHLVDPVGCVFPVGVTDHLRLECGNDHVDVGPNFPWDVFMRQVNEAPGPDLSILHPADRQHLKRLLWARAKVHRRGGCQKAPHYCAIRRRERAAVVAANERMHRLGLTTAGRRARHQLLHDLVPGLH